MLFVTGCHKVYPLGQRALLANIDGSEPLMWFEASGFLYTINPGFSCGILSNILLLPRVIEILQLWSAQSSSSSASAVHRGCRCWCGSIQILDLGLGAGWNQIHQLSCLWQLAKRRTSSPAAKALEPALQHCLAVGPDLPLSHSWAGSPTWVSSTVLPMQGRDVLSALSSATGSERQASSASL